MVYNYGAQLDHLPDVTASRRPQSVKDWHVLFLPNYPSVAGASDILSAAMSMFAWVMHEAQSPRRPGIILTSSAFIVINVIVGQLRDWGWSFAMRAGNSLGGSMLPNKPNKVHCFLPHIKHSSRVLDTCSTRCPRCTTAMYDSPLWTYSWI